MAKKGHLFLGSTESQKNRLLWQQYFPGRTISTDLGRTTENEAVPTLKNYFNWYCYTSFDYVACIRLLADSTCSL